MIRHSNRRVRSPPIIHPERPPMPQDDLPLTSKDDRSAPNTLSAEERWAERMKPFRQQNLTPSERQSLAAAIRWSRRQRFQEEV
jgi:hypothetical protein